ncbi:MAG: tetratricopeptide repeat protein [Thermogutta sp.]
MRKIVPILSTSLLLFASSYLRAVGQGIPAAQEVSSPTMIPPMVAPTNENSEVGRIQSALGTSENPRDGESANPGQGLPSEETALRIESANEPRSSSSPGTESTGETIAPRPDPQTTTEPVTVETAAFNGITPGVSTVQELTQRWGPPKNTIDKGIETFHLYEIPPFEQVEVHIQKDKVQAIIIRLDKTYPADLVATHLELAEIRPVLVSDPQGEVLGQSFPERGVLFSFAPAGEARKSSNLVTQIILTPVSPEPFILRAETFWQAEPEKAARDLEEALKLDSKAHRAWWFLSRIQKELGQLKEAAASAQHAVQLDPANLHYRLTLAEILDQIGQDDLAIQQLEQVIAVADQRPHLKARALCSLGTIYQTMNKPDYKKALDYHFEAVKVAQPLRTDPYPAIRIEAKEVLVDAHLGAALDIAWGPWEQKDSVVPRWLERASALAKDLIDSEHQSADKLFRVSTTALATSVAMPQSIEPAPWIDAMDQCLQQLETEASPIQQARLKWDYGVALYDAVQCFQVNGQHDLAQQYGEKAIQALEAGMVGRQSSGSDLYLVGRLYFRLGAVHAIQNKDHRQAISYFDKAIPLFRRAGHDVPETSIGRLGETLVSMGVSYWETGQREKAISLTEEGLQLMEKAVQLGLMNSSALDVPKSNLQTMRQVNEKLAKNSTADSANTQR